MKPLSFRSKILAGFAAAFLILLVGAFSFRSAREALDAARWVAHTQEAIGRLDALLADLIDVETGARGYVLSGDPQYLDPYERGARRVPADVAVVRRLTADNASQQRRLDSLVPALDARIDAARQVVEARRAEAIAAGTAATQEQRGKALMDDVRRRIAAMQADEQRLLTTRTAARAERERAVEVVIAVGSLLAFALVVLMLRVIQQDVALQQRTAQERDASLDQLAKIQRVTDAALAPLALDNLLTELMVRLRELLSVDTACVLLLMRDGIHLELCKCVGPTQEIEDRVLIPIGQGVEGRIAERRLPMTVDDIAAESVYDPVVREHFRSLLGAPLIAHAGDAERVIGVVHVETIQPRRFTDAERNLLVLVAQRAGEAIERARLYQAERRSEERFRLLVDSVQDYAIYQLDPEGRVTNWNAGAERLTGYTAGQALGRSIDDLLYTGEDGDSGRLRQILAEARERGHIQYSGWRLRRDRSRFWADIVTSAIHDEDDGHLIGFASVTRDLTERKRAEEALMAARDAAESADQAKSQFLATMSHEIRTPINAIIGYVELLELGLDGPLTDAQLARLTRVRVSARHLLGLVNEILDLSKIEAQQLRVERVRSNITEAVTTAIGLIYPQAAAKSLSVVNSCSSSDAEVAYMGDPHRVEQILVNLLSNAVKFTPQRGRLEVDCGLTLHPSASARLGSQECWTYVRVADTGVGIPAEHQESIFEPFVQAVDSENTQRGIYTRQHSGTGLGLAISRRLARLMGGDITVESAPNEGAAFTLWLPAPPEVRAAVAGDGTGCSTEERRVRQRPVKGLAAVGNALRGAHDDVIRVFVQRLTGEVRVPGIQQRSVAELEDHLRTLLTDLASALVFIEEARDEASRALRDGTEIQRVIAERHGAQRAALGWSTTDYRRELAIFGEVIETTLRHRHSFGPDADLTAAIGILRQLLEHVERAAVRGMELAQSGPSDP